MNKVRACSMFCIFFAGAGVEALSTYARKPFGEILFVLKQILECIRPLFFCGLVFVFCICPVKIYKNRYTTIMCVFPFFGHLVCSSCLD